MQADAFSGFGRLYVPGREGGPVIEAACWAHARRKFYEMADLKKAPIAIEAVGRIDALFAIEREINGLPAERRLNVRTERSRPLVAELEVWLRGKRMTLSAKSPVAKAIDYLLKRWPAFTRFLDDGQVCLSNNAAERAIRPLAVGRRNWTFAGSDTGGERAAALYTLIETALCRARHKQVYADRRTMPNASCDRGNMKRFARHFDRERVADARHSSHPQRVLRNSRSRSFDRNRWALARSYGFSLPSADSFSSRCA